MKRAWSNRIGIRTSDLEGEGAVGVAGRREEVLVAVVGAVAQVVAAQVAPQVPDGVESWRERRQQDHDGAGHLQGSGAKGKR